MLRNSKIIILVALFAVVSVADISFAEEWNPKKITIIMPNSVGGSQHRTTNAFAKVWSKHLGATVSVVPTPGASGRIGYDKIMKSKRDGTIIGSSNLGSASIMYISQRPEWNWQEKIYFLGMMAVDPGVIMVREDSKYKKIQDVIDEAKEKEIVIGVGPWKSVENLFIQQTVKELGLKNVRVIPIGGGSDLVTALLGGHIDIALGKVANLQRNNEQMRALAMTFDENPVADITDNAPTFDSVYNKDLMNAGSFRVVFIPKELWETHPDRAQKLQDTFIATQQDPEYLEALTKAGSDSRLVVELRHDAIQNAIVQNGWEQFLANGDIFKTGLKGGTLTATIEEVTKDGKYIHYTDEKGKKWQTRIHREDSEFWLNGAQIEGEDNIKAERAKLKAGDECEIQHDGMPIVATVAKCVST